MSVGKFHIPGDATKREYAAYIIIATNRTTGERRLYVGKTGDNRDGCNPVVSRAGNHFSFNRIHSQMRNSLLPDEPHDFDFDCFFTTFGGYVAPEKSRDGMNVINEMERQLRRMVYETFGPLHLNPYLAKGWLSRSMRSKRQAIATIERMTLLSDLVQAVKEFVEKPAI